VKYFKNKTGDVFAISPIQTPEKDWVKLTENEAEAHLNPIPTTDVNTAELR
jgi:hypothetical protein